MPIQPRTPSGFNEYLPEEQLEFNRLLDIIRSTYERYGFTPLDTPDLELSEILLAKTGGETAQQIYRFEHGRNDLSLRYDLTVPLARFVAEHEGQLVFPFRRYQIGKVHRAERAQAGRYREFYQCDIDVVGSNSPLVDAELPAVINEIFSKFQIGEFTIRINDRRVLTGYLESLDLINQAPEILRVIDKLEKLSEEVIREELAALGVNVKAASRLLEFVNLQGTSDDVLGRLKEISAATEATETFRRGVTSLEQVLAGMRALGVPAHRYRLDLKIARGLDYYTGTVYETVLNDYPELGSICSGGRYDNLASSYTRSELPGVGISIGLTRLFYGLLEHGLIKPGLHSPARIVVLPLEPAQFQPALELAAGLRKQGENVMTYTEPNGLKQKLRYADRMGFTWALIIGPEEAATSQVMVRNLTTAEGSLVPTSEVAQAIAPSN